MLLSFAVCGLGLALAFAFSNPVGFVVDGLGVAFFVYDIFTGEEKKMGKKKTRRMKNDKTLKVYNRAKISPFIRRTARTFTTA